MNEKEDIVWLYKVLDAKNMSVDQLQTELDSWSNHVMPHELIQQDDKLIIKFQSCFKRDEYFSALADGMNKTMKYGV